MDERLKQEIRDIVGEDNFTDRLIDLIAYSRDASEHKHRPDAAVWVHETEQVSSILRLADRERFPVVARGAGTGLTGMAVPSEGGLILDMGRMDKVLEINIEDRLVVVQPGVVYADLNNALLPFGFFFPPDPASGRVSTIGGNVATNAGGIRGAKYGTTKDYVLALEIVLPNGEVLHTGSRCMKSVSGYDLTRLFVGSEGTLGIFTEITLKINPRPPLSATATAAFEKLEDAGRAVGEIMRSGILPSALEIIDRQTITAINQNTDLNLPEVVAILFAETDGYTAEETKFQLNVVTEIFEKNGAVSVRRADTKEEAEALWTARKSAGGVIPRISKNLFVEDLCVPMSKVPEMLQTIDELSKKYDVKIPTVGHAGDGNLHPAISIDSTNREEVRRMEKVAEALFRKVIQLGGTLTGEHGIGLSKAPFMKMEHDEVAMGLMKALKQLLDPNNILNSGKMALEK
ncbi:MAG: FAD-linked oxidase C-terminal domain-containing protein [Desulfatiglandaceae bacterium]